jgi:hypothetical protein
MQTQTGTPSRRSRSADTIARGLAWFSIGLGVAELLMARSLGRALGLSPALLRAYGAREIATGLGIFAFSGRRAPWVWARVAGDALDVATLGAAMRGRRPLSAAVAMGAVAPVVLTDLVCARELSASEKRMRTPYRDYSSRSGFKRPANEMRGAARSLGSKREARTPEPFRDVRV